jgi:hypothetical protein
MLEWADCADETLDSALVKIEYQISAFTL